MSDDERKVASLAYHSPSDGRPFSGNGLRDLARQLELAAKLGDFALLEMAALAIRGMLDDMAEMEHDAYLYRTVKQHLRDAGCPIETGCHVPTVLSEWLNSLDILQQGKYNEHSTTKTKRSNGHHA